MQHNNPVLEFNWEKDIRETPEPQKNVYLNAPNASSFLTDTVWNPWLAGVESHELVQADPQDIISFNEPVMGEVCFQANKMIWQRTIDKYLYQYFRLSEQREQGEVKWMSIDLPPNISEKYYSFNRTSSKRKQHKFFTANLQYFKACNYKIEKKELSEFSVPRYLGPCYLNQCCRDFSTKANATALKSSLYYDGLVFRSEEDYGVVDFIPPFQLEDYIYHEYLTGLSLSIEITAVLLEIEDVSLRNKAFDAFCDKALKEIVRSHLIYTRNTVARHFFQQIIWERTSLRYRWKGYKYVAGIPEDQWDGVVERALVHLNTLRCSVDFTDVPYDAIDDSMAHIYSLLSIVKIPVNIPEYVKCPQYGLAAFCHINHNHVRPFLEELGVYSNNKVTQIYCNRSEEHMLFRKVHSKVKAMIFSE